MGLFNNHRQPTYACLDAGTRAFRVTSTGGIDHLIDCVLDQVAVERLVPESLMVRGLEPTVDEQFAATGQGYAIGDSGSPVWYGSKAQGIVSAMNCNISGTWDCYSPNQSVEVWKNQLRVLTTAP